LAPVQTGEDAGHVLAALRPLEPDSVAVAFADPHGFLIIRYAQGYDGNLMRKDLERLVKS
jgi:hypothetical protein